MKFTGSHILEAKQFDRKGIEELLKRATEMDDFLIEKKDFAGLLAGKVMASLFYEPSTRTRLSFETAMLRLGGTVTTAANIEMSSLKKGETLSDTGKVISSYVDVIVMRHPQNGSVAQLASKASVPVINAGDGANQHPTQALLDLYTIQKKFGSIDGKTITLVGDLKYGRTVHSLLEYLKHFKVSVRAVSPKALCIPDEVLSHFEESGVKVECFENLAEGVNGADVVYMTRIQEERFENTNEYLKYKGVYVLNADFVKKTFNKNAIILHPLPRIDEIAGDVDDLSQAYYFEQVRNGVPVRMALLSMILC